MFFEKFSEDNDNKLLILNLIYWKYNLIIILFQRGISLNNFGPIKILFSLLQFVKYILYVQIDINKLKIKKYFWSLKYFFEIFNTFKFCMIESKRSE